MTATIEQLRALAERLAGATEGDSELDYIIARMLGLDGGPFIEGDDEAPEFTASIDAALALVDRLLPGAEYELTTMYGVARVSLPLNGSFGPSYGNDETGNVPLAILRALVAALLAQAESTQ